MIPILLLSIIYSGTNRTDMALDMNHTSGSPGLSDIRGKPVNHLHLAKRMLLFWNTELAEVNCLVLRNHRLSFIAKDYWR